MRPGYADAHHNLALAFIGMRDKRSALEECQRLQTLDENLAREINKEIDECCVIDPEGL